MRLSGFILMVLVAFSGILSGCGGDQSAPTGASAAANRGQLMYAQCRACHSLEEGGPNMVGPNLYGMFNRKAGLAPGFGYSDVMADTDVVWTIETMDDWLAQPSVFLPGNRMIFAGIKDPEARASLIEYLQQETGAGQEPGVEKEPDLE